MLDTKDLVVEKVAILERIEFASMKSNGTNPVWDNLDFCVKMSSMKRKMYCSLTVEIGGS